MLVLSRFVVFSRISGASNSASSLFCDVPVLRIGIGCGWDSRMPLPNCQLFSVEFISVFFMAAVAGELQSKQREKEGSFLQTW